MKNVRAVRALVRMVRILVEIRTRMVKMVKIWVKMVKMMAKLTFLPCWMVKFADCYAPSMCLGVLNPYLMKLIIMEGVMLILKGFGAGGWRGRVGMYIFRMMVTIWFPVI